MAVIFWFSDGVGTGVDKAGGPNKGIPIPTVMVRWIRKQNPSLIVYGGDVYQSGSPAEFDAFFEQMDKDVTLMCEVAGNHDRYNAGNQGDKGRIPVGYETFWNNHRSKQHIEKKKRGAARYDHVIPLDGWRLIFVDTGEYETNPWPQVTTPAKLG